MGIISDIFTRQVELYEFTHKNQKYYFTSSDKEVLFDSQVYIPQYIKRTSISSTVTETKKVVKLSVLKDFVVADFFKKLNPREISVKITRASRDDLSQSRQLFIGVVNTCSFRGNQAEIECKPFTQTGAGQICRYAYSTKCNHHVYNKGCKLDIDDFSVVANITVVAADGITFGVTTTGGNPVDYYTNGVMIAPNGDARQIISNTANQVKVLTPYSELNVGDVVKIAAGCNRTSGDCKNKFNNFNNFLGFEYVPSRNPFSDGV